MTNKSKSSGKSSHRSEVFDFDSLSRQVIVVPAVNSTFEVNHMVQHTEACWFLRKHIVEVAAKQWTTEMKDLNPNTFFLAMQKR